MFCYFMQVDGVSALIVQSALSKLVSGRCYHAVSLENLHTIDITRYLVSQGYKMDPVDYGWWMDRVKSLATSAMQPLLNTFAALPVKETKGQVMRFSSDMPHRNGSGLAQLERMVRWCARRASSPGFSTRPAACRCRAAPRRRRTPPRPRPRSACPRCSPSRWRRPPRSLRPCRRAELGRPECGYPCHRDLHPESLRGPQSAMEQHHGCPGKYTAGMPL